MKPILPRLSAARALVIVTMLGMSFAVYGRLQRRIAFERLVSVNATIMYSESVKEDGLLVFRSLPQPSIWMFTILDADDDHIAHIGVNNLHGVSSIIKSLSYFPDLRNIDFSDSDLTDADLKELSQMPQLRALVLDGTQVTGFGALNLARATNLQYLSLNNTSISPQEIEQLMQTAPGLKLRCDGHESIATKGTR